ncbi:MAG: D-glycero-beta-D-manno-heptose 1-phosphate adenylyltransferase [Bacteroidetes bacterium]|nr:D-glycero-beta-D-manno-heptose 1-phosphate adenylyltransferase [Bacteroidota bacterium]
MHQPEKYLEKILTPDEAKLKIAGWRHLGHTVVFTNGVFDLLHEGHLHSLERAAREGDHLVVAINSDESVKRLKGPNRPIQSQTTRARVVAALLLSDVVIVFEEDTPAALIEHLQPDVLVKGGDYSVEQIAGAESVLKRGGRIVINPLIEGFSTTASIQKMKRD